MFNASKIFEPFKNKMWLASPTMHGDEQKFVQEAFDTNWVSTVGANLNELEKNICKYVGCKYAVALASGTSALHLAVKLAGVKAGDKVFCSDLTFSATVNPVLYEKGTPIFIDSERDTWNLNPVALERAFKLFPDVKVVAVANLYGTPAKLDEIQNICAENSAILIEDAAESLGATYKGQQTGTFGQFNAISFNGNKIITTSGGGMLLTDDEKAAFLARKWSTQSRESAPWYQHIDVGYNYRMSNIVAGIGRGQLLHLQEHIALKKNIYERYRDGLKDLPVKMNPYDEKIMEPNFWLSCLLIDEKFLCRQVRSDNQALFIGEYGKTCPTEILETLAKFNAEGRPIWKPMHLQPIYYNNPFVAENDGEDIGADIFNRGLCLPSDIKMTAEEQDKIIEIIRACFE